MCALPTWAWDRQLLRLIAPRDHLLKDNEMYSLQDLVDLQGDLLLPLMRRIIVAYREHVGKCEVRLHVPVCRVAEAMSTY